MPTGNATHAAAQIAQLQRTIARVIKGKDEVIEMALTALLARGHLLIEDVPGVGKTTLAQALARSFHCSFHRIQFTSDLLPSDVIGVSVFNPADQQFEFKPGPLFANIVLADEINRTTPKTQSALLEAMSESQVTVDNHTHPLLQPFMVLATQNPVEHHGTYPLPESQLDRFLLRVRMGYPARASEKDILRANGRAAVDSLEPAMEAADVVALQASDGKSSRGRKLAGLCAGNCGAHAANGTVESGSEHARGDHAASRGASARVLHGRDFCVPDDFKRLIVPVFAHRVVVNTRYVSTQKKSEQAEMILREIVDSVRVPL